MSIYMNIDSMSSRGLMSTCQFILLMQRVNVLAYTSQESDSGYPGSKQGLTQSYTLDVPEADGYTWHSRPPPGWTRPRCHSEKSV